LDYSKLQVDEGLRYIHFGSEIEDAVAQELTSALVAICNKNHKPITLVINSSGGFVASAIAIYDAIRACPAKIHGVVIGDCLSAAVLVLQACDSRTMTENSRLMFHLGTAGVRRTTSPDLTREAEEEGRIMQQFNDLIALRSGLKSSEIAKLENPVSYLTATDAKERGLVDGIAPILKKFRSRKGRKRS